MLCNTKCIYNFFKLFHLTSYFVRFCFIEKINNNKKQQKKKKKKKLNKFSVAGKRTPIHPRPFWNFTLRILGVYCCCMYECMMNFYIFFYIFFIILEHLALEIVYLQLTACLLRKTSCNPFDSSNSNIVIHLRWQITH